MEDYSFLEGKTTEEILKWAFETHGKRCAIGTSLQKTGIAIIDIVSKILGEDFRVFFVDTLKFPKETYKLLEEVEKRYSLDIERYSPTQKSVEKMYQMYGQFPYYKPFGRELCCKLRKVDPSEEALKSVDVWVSGLRASQSEHRKNTVKMVEVIYRKKRPIIKINPLLNWNDKKLELYGKENKLPYNKLYDYVSTYGEKYQVLGCKCCHIPTISSVDTRAGKFPWEAGNKECGLHVESNMEGGGI